MGIKQGTKDIEENRTNEKRADTIESYLMDNATIMNEKNRGQFGGQLCYFYGPDRWPSMEIQCYFRESDGSEITDFKGFYVVFCKCRFTMQDGVSLGEMKEYLTFAYNSNVKGMPINQAEEILNSYLNNH